MQSGWTREEVMVAVPTPPPAGGAGGGCAGDGDSGDGETVAPAMLRSRAMSTLSMNALGQLTEYEKAFNKLQAQVRESTH
jgi:hypothetical protein